MRIRGASSNTYEEKRKRLHSGSRGEGPEKRSTIREGKRRKKHRGKKRSGRILGKKGGEKEWSRQLGGAGG